MSLVYSHMTMSLDGFIADPTDGVVELFDWFNAGEVSVPDGNGLAAFAVDDGGARVLHELIERAGALVCGRRLFEHTHGWNDQHPTGAPVVVVTHQAPSDTSLWPRTTFVDNLPDAIAAARKIAGDKDVNVASAQIASQTLDAGLLDEIYVSIAPVVLGAGIRYFDNITTAPYRLQDPAVIPGRRATHLRYRVRHH